MSSLWYVLPGMMWFRKYGTNGCLFQDEVAAAQPVIDEKTSQLVSKGRWSVPGYKVWLKLLRSINRIRLTIEQEKFGDLSLLQTTTQHPFFCYLYYCKQRSDRNIERSWYLWSESTKLCLTDMEVLIVRTFGMKASQVCTSLCAVVKFYCFCKSRHAF